MKKLLLAIFLTWVGQRMAENPIKLSDNSYKKRLEESHAINRRVEIMQR